MRPAGETSDAECASASPCRMNSVIAGLRGIGCAPGNAGFSTARGNLRNRMRVASVKLYLPKYTSFIISSILLILSAIFYVIRKAVSLALRQAFTDLQQGST